MQPGLSHRMWSKDRLALAVLGVGSLVATLGWRATTRPMGDTATYRTAARGLAEGWPELLERTPGYPLVLLLTGSSDGSTRALFLVQLLAHVIAVVLVIDMGRWCGLGLVGSTAIAVLLMMPPVLLRVVHEGSEAVAALLLTTIAWLLVRRPLGSRWVSAALLLGTTCGVAALVRPTYALVSVPAAMCFALTQPSPHRVRRSFLVAGPALGLVIGLVAFNGARFNAPGLTPLTGVHLGSRTSTYVEELPARYEPARSIMIRRRDAALLEGEESAPANYLNEARDDLAIATGLQGPELDRYILEMQVHLITHHPLNYTTAVFTSGLNYTTMDSQPAILGLGRPAAQGLQVLHLLLGLSAVGTMAVVPGLWLGGHIPRRVAAVLGVAGLLIVYTGAISVLVESGTARLRAPSEPLLALVMITSASLAWQAIGIVRPRVTQ